MSGVLEDRLEKLLREHRDDDIAGGFYDVPDPRCGCGYDLAPDDALSWSQHVAQVLAAEVVTVLGPPF